MWTPIIVTTCFVTTLGQLIIPKRPLGFVYRDGRCWAPVQFDVHMGPLCSDSEAAFPTIKAVADHYGPELVKLTFHQFPLPYHLSAFTTAVLKKHRREFSLVDADGMRLLRDEPLFRLQNTALIPGIPTPRPRLLCRMKSNMATACGFEEASGAHAVDTISGGGKTWDWFRVIYANLYRLSNDATADLSNKYVVWLLSELADEIGINPDVFDYQMKNNFSSLDTQARAAFKYSCSRGIASTPTFLLNGVTVVEARADWSLTQWREVIDGLLEVSQDDRKSHRQKTRDKPQTRGSALQGKARKLNEIPGWN